MVLAHARTSSTPTAATLVRAVTLALAAGPLGGCVTAALWEELPDRDDGRIDWCEGSTVGAIALTPVTVAVDAALVAGWLWLIAEGDDCCCD
ncbi:MAG: hypothetical protein EXS13_13655 [Planctomycetes bacterium]|nr:hypothetical protein [Planctomycetota bacterium]